MTQTIEQLTARVRELEEENARLKAESRDASLGLNDYYGRKLAVEQLNNNLLREALEAVIKVHGYESGIPVEAISTQASTEALDKHVAEKVKEKTDALHYRMEHCYSIDHVKIQCELDKITKQRDLAVEALEWIASSLPQIGVERVWMLDHANKTLAAIKESEAK